MRLWLLCVLVIATPSLAQSDPLSPEERAWVDGHGPIRYAPDPGYPPFEFVTENGVEGINVDLLNRISRNLDVEFETVIYDNWTAVLEAMQAGEVDLLGSLANTPEREVYMDFYGPYMQVGEVFYVRTDSPLTSNADMDGKRVAVIQDYAAGQWLAENRPGIRLVPVPDMKAGLEALSTGQVDGFFENVPVAGYVIRKEGFNNIRILDEPLYYSDANWGVPEDNAILLSIIDKGMDSVSPGEQTAIFEFWSGYDLGVQRAVPEGPKWIAPVMWGLLGVTLVASVWIVSLRRTVARHTAELQTLNKGLEARVAARTEELQAANERLAAFASTVSHDLKQPLMVMSLQSRITQELLKKGGDPDLRLLDAQVERMQSYIETLLDFTRVAKPKDPADVDIATLVDDLRPVVAAGRACTIDVEPGLSIHADPQLLRIMMQNLLANACKFGAARVQVRRDGDHFIVRDDGRGFDAARLGEQVFEPFVRGDESHDVPGTGIGLATVARIVAVHGGRIWIESSPGAGTTVHWTMPSGRVVAAPAF